MTDSTETFGTTSASVLVRLAELTSTLKKRVEILLQPTPGDRILDVGCGLGVDVVSLARELVPNGLAVGVDKDHAMLLAAKQHAREAGVASWVRHQQASAECLPFRACSFDACRSERLLQHVHAPSNVLEEMVRVTKPAGRIVVADADWGTLSIDTTELEIERRVVHFIADSLPSGHVGRQLRRLFIQQGLVRVEVEAVPITWTDYSLFTSTSLSFPLLDRLLVDSGTVSPAELRRFRISLELAAEQNAFFASGNMIIAAGRTPSAPIA